MLACLLASLFHSVSIRDASSHAKSNSQNILIWMQMRIVLSLFIKVFTSSKRTIKVEVEWLDQISVGSKGEGKGKGRGRRIRMRTRTRMRNNSNNEETRLTPARPPAWPTAGFRSSNITQTTYISVSNIRPARA